MNSQFDIAYNDLTERILASAYKPLLNYDYLNKAFSSIIVESYDEFDFGNKVLELIEKSKPFVEISFNDILKNVSERFQKINKNHINKLDYALPLYVFKFDFTNATSLKYICKRFNIQLFDGLSNMPIKTQNEVLIRFFREHLYETSGITFKAHSYVFMCLNTNLYDYSTIRHELGHYFQILFNTNIRQTNVISNKFSNYVDKNEFLIQGKIDFVNQMTDVYFKWFKQKSIEEFIQILNEFINT